MAVAYVLEQNTSVRLEGERLIIERKREVLHALHIYKLNQLVLFGNVSITPPVIRRLLRDGIDTIFMSRNGRYRGRLQPPMSKNISLRCEQFDKLRKDAFCLHAARSIVAGKLANMKTVLMRLNRNREDLALENHILQIKNLQKKAGEADTLDTVRGFEGRASAVYFDGLSEGFLDDDVRFTKRVRRPPTDPVNALLSLGYTLLFNTVMSAVSLVGFDPYLGSLHVVEYGRPSLALDLMEEWRPVIVDTLTLSVFNLKSLTLNDFIQEKKLGGDEDADNGIEESVSDSHSDQGGNQAAKLPVRLTDGGFRKFIVQFERKMNQKVRYEPSGQQLGYRDCIREQVRHFARVIRGEEEEYRPFSMR